MLPSLQRPLDAAECPLSPDYTHSRLVVENVDDRLRTMGGVLKLPAELILEIGGGALGGIHRCEDAIDITGPRDVALRARSSR